MSDKPETLAAVLAKYRRDIAGGQFFTPTQEYILRLLDRIEAAAERERNAHTNDIHDALYKATGIPGNAAELREALIYVRDLMRRVRDGDRISSLAFLGVVEHALAAPARNCDRFATKDEARRAYWAYREPLEFNNKPFVAITEWLFAPAEGGDHA